MLLLLLAACQTKSSDPFDPVTAIPLAAVSTVLEVTWKTDAPCVGTVTYGIDGEAGFVTAPEPEATVHHQRLLLNLPSNQDVTYAISCVDADGGTLTGDYTGRTGPLPEGLSDLHLTGTPEASTDLLTLPVVGTRNAALLIDLQGRIVWYHLASNEHAVTRVRLSADGTNILYNQAEGNAESTADTGRVFRIGFDGEKLAELSTPQLTHDFVELPDGTVAAICSDARDAMGFTFDGDLIREVTPDGTGSVVWNAWDVYDPSVNHTHYMDQDGWTHANALDYDPDTDSYWLSIRNFDSLIRIQRPTGEIVEAIGGDAPTILYADDATATHGQHQFQWLPDGLLVFDNDYTGQSSRAVEFGRDGDTLTQRWEWHPDPTYWNYALGDVFRGDDGRTRVTISMAGQIVQLDADDQLQWQLNSDFGSVFGYSDRVPALVQAP